MVSLRLRIHSQGERPLPILSIRRRSFEPGLTGASSRTVARRSTARFDFQIVKTNRVRRMCAMDRIACRQDGRIFSYECHVLN